MSGETCWDKLCASDIHALTHRFTRLPFETTACRREGQWRQGPLRGEALAGASHVSRFGFFLCKGTLPLTRAVIRDRGRGDRRLIRHCLATGDVDMAADSWWSILARIPKLILRCRTVHNNMWSPHRDQDSFPEAQESQLGGRIVQLQCSCSWCATSGTSLGARQGDWHRFAT